MKFKTIGKKIDILEHAFAANAGAYYNINLTKNIVPGVMYQVIEDKEYSLNEQMGLPENASFTDVVSYWGEMLDEEEKPAYYEFLSVTRLLDRYQQGESHVYLKYWTQSAIFEPMLAEQHIVMYTDEETGDVLAVTYVLDLTQKFKEVQYAKELKENQRALEFSLEELNKEKKILDALCIDYNTVYLCDLQEDSMISLKREELSNAGIIQDRLTIEEQRSLSYRMQYYFEHFVIKESAPDFTYKLSADYLMHYLKNNKRFAYRFRAIPNPAGQQCFEVQVVRLAETDGFKVVMGFRYIDDIIEEQERQKIKLENAFAEVKLDNEIINSISKLYWLIYRMDLVDGTYEEISAGQEVHKLTGKRGNTDEVFGEVCEKVVAAEYLEIMRHFLDTSTLVARLQNTESVAMEYRTASGFWHLARFIVKKRDPLGRVTNVLYVVRQINEEKQTELQYKQTLIKTNRVLSGLSQDYTTAFALDLDTDEYEMAFNQNTNHAAVHEEIKKFSEYVDQYATDFVLPEFRDPMRIALSSEDIRKRFETEDEYYFYFETTPNAAGLSCFQAHIIKQYDEKKHFAFLGFCSVDEIVKKERYYQEALQKANDALQWQLDLITSSLPGGVKISNDDETYSFKYVSEQFAHMLGYETSKELMDASGGSIVGLAHPDDLETGLADALDQYSRADHYETTYRVRCKDGSWKYIEDRGNKIRSSDGTIEHWNLILDNNELMEKTIALESEKKANQSKSDFLSRMSHDMRTPLNGIIGLLDICMKHPDDRKLVDSSRLKARIAADHLQSLINDTLELSKLENNEVPLYEEAFHAPTLFHEVETLAQMRAEEEGITLIYEIVSGQLKHPYLIGSPLYVKQILLNLIINGIKYNREEGSVKCTLEEREGTENEVVLDITIQDTGIGMEKDFIKDIFKPFVQEDKGARSTYMGTGLGMAIVHNLIERMNGTIQIDSMPGVGTTIHVALPFQIAESGNIREAQTEKKQLEDESKKCLRILLAEDNELNREIATFILKDEGMKVTEAVDGKQAVSLFMNKPENYYDAILMDVMMPVMDGYQATKAIRSSGRKDAKTIPIIAMTANAFDEDRRKSNEAGMNAHLSKPLETKKLLEEIVRLCEK